VHTYNSAVILVFLEKIVKLTRRQETFIRNLLDLYHQAQGPIHYSELAERLKVNRFTAYDMLRLLEEKGFVSSEYKLGDDKSGPGRSTVVFTPTTQAHQMVAVLTDEPDNLDWEAAKDRALSKLRNGLFEDQELSHEVFARIPSDVPGGDESISYCFELMTIIALNLSKNAKRNIISEYIAQILPIECQNSAAGLCSLAGFAMGVLASGKEENDWHRELFQHVNRYQELVIGMDDKRSAYLAKGLRQIFEPFENK
jgi:DNA-binding MarR family transcriptional regulator